MSQHLDSMPSMSEVNALNDKIVGTDGAINLSSYTAKTFIDSIVANGNKIYYCSASGGNKLSDLPITQAGVYIVRADTYYKSLDFMGTNGYDYHYDYTNNAWTSLNSNLATKPSILTGSLSSVSLANGTQAISYSAPSGMPNKNAYMILLYSQKDNVYHHWNPQNGSRNLQNNDTWVFNVLNQRGASVDDTATYVVLYN